MGFKFDRYQLFVNGSFSKISVSSKPKTKYELFYGTSESGFNTGMTLLLQCVKNFMEWCEKQGLDELISGERVKKCAIGSANSGNDHNDVDKIEGSSIVYSSDSKEQWTRACKCLLMNVQRICLISKFSEDLNQRKKHQEDSVYSTVSNNRR